MLKNCSVVNLSGDQFTKTSSGRTTSKNSKTTISIWSRR